MTVGTAPCIALQLQSFSLGFAAFTGNGTEGMERFAILVTLGLATFPILFGTRTLDVDERHRSIFTAIAQEAVVRLVAFVAAGAFVVWGLSAGPAGIFAMIEASPIAGWRIDGPRWLGVTMLSGTAFLCLPRIFQVHVVANDYERHLATASLAFPLHLAALSLLVVPIAGVGLALMAEGVSPETFVLTLPLSQDRDGLALLAFLGGYSSATSMAIVAMVALFTMISNNVVTPSWLRLVPTGATRSGDVRYVIIGARRASIVGLTTLGYVYYRVSGGGASPSSIGLISFCGVA